MIRVLPFLLLILLSACTKDDLSPFCDALINKDISFVKNHVDNIANNLFPYPDYIDPIGHEINLQILADELSIDPCLTASVLCYACIETYPYQSELLITINSESAFFQIIMDIAVPEDGSMYFVSLH